MHSSNHRLWILCAGLLAGSSLSATALAAEQQAPPYPPLMIPQPLTADDSGFKPIFDGKTLNGWDGDTAYWRVENGAIVGETTKENPLEAPASIILWRGGKPADFDLKLQFQISPLGNSGVQYRSTEQPFAKWTVRGYQADISGPEWGKLFVEDFGRENGFNMEHFTGLNYHEWGRTWLALQGQLTYAADGKPQQVLALVGDPATLANVDNREWNDMRVIARGNVLIHIVNDRVVSIVIDDDKANRHMEGLLGLQVHGGPPMKVGFRNIRLKTF